MVSGKHMDSVNQPNPTLEPADIFQIDTIEKLKIIANPLRMQILDCLIPKALTVKEIGDLLNIQSNTRYYHISELENAGMIRVVDTKVKSGIQQKFYRATGKYYRLEPTLLHNGSGSGAPGSAALFLSGALEISASQLRRSFRNGSIDSAPDITRVTRRVISADPDRLVAFRERLLELEAEFSDLHDENGPASFELSYALFPTVRSIDHSTD